MDLFSQHFQISFLHVLQINLNFRVMEQRLQQ
jgi:hypothetical protein